MLSIKKGEMFILSSPSGAGKTTLVKKIAKRKKFKISISHTTRLPRPNERDGKDYYFTSKNKFRNLIKKKNSQNMQRFLIIIMALQKKKFMTILKKVK